jgi:hypothetical protein
MKRNLWLADLDFLAPAEDGSTILRWLATLGGVTEELLPFKEKYRLVRKGPGY